MRIKLVFIYLFIFLVCLSSVNMCKTDKITEFYVSLVGDDANPGNLEKPFATIAGARDAVRILKSKIKTPITVWVREGSYYLSEPLVFNPEDSGSEQQPICYAAYPGEKVTISGGIKIQTDWRPSDFGIAVCSLPAEQKIDYNFTQLFVNDRRQVLARYPNYNPADPGKSGYISARGADKWPHKELYYDPITFTKNRWRDPRGAILHIFPESYWGNLQWLIRSIDYKNNAILLDKGGWQIHEKTPNLPGVGVTLGSRSRFFVENIFEELDDSGEWYLDRDNDLLYFKPPMDLKLDEAKIEAPILEQVIIFKGDRSNPVHHISLVGFQIAHTTTTFLHEYEYPSLGDWGIYRAGAVYLEGTEDCTIEKCYFYAVGGNAVFASNYNQRLSVHDNIFAETGESAVCLVGKSNLDKSKSSKCRFCGTLHPWAFNPPSENYPSQCSVSNNLIHDIGFFGKQTSGVFISLASKIVVSHNHIYNTPRAAICINDESWGGHVIQYNDIHHTVRETSDHGPLNSWGRGPYWCHEQAHGTASHPAGDVKAYAKYTTTIHNNRFSDKNGWGIDLDDGSSNYDIYNNLCLGISIKLREGDFRTVENNIFVNPANPPGFHVGCENNSDRFIRNIISFSSTTNPQPDDNSYPGQDDSDIYKFIFPPVHGRWISECDYNLFANDNRPLTFSVTPRGDNMARWWEGGKKYSLMQWRSLGYDQHSIFADPMFIDAQNGNYQVHPESPALKLGFKNFSMQEFGLRDDFHNIWLEQDIHLAN